MHQENKWTDLECVWHKMTKDGKRRKGQPRKSKNESILGFSLRSMSWIMNQASFCSIEKHIIKDLEIEQKG